MPRLHQVDSAKTPCSEGPLYLKITQRVFPLSHSGLILGRQLRLLLVWLLLVWLELVLMELLRVQLLLLLLLLLLMVLLLLILLLLLLRLLMRLLS